MGACPFVFVGSWTNRIVLALAFLVGVREGAAQLYSLSDLVQTRLCFIQIRICQPLVLLLVGRGESVWNGN